MLQPPKPSVFIQRAFDSGAVEIELVGLTQLYSLTSTQTQHGHRHGMASLLSTLLKQHGLALIGAFDTARLGFIQHLRHER